MITSEPVRVAPTPPEPDPFLEHPVARWLLSRQGQLQSLDRRRPWLLDTVLALLVLLFTLGQVITGGGEHRDTALEPRVIAIRLAAAVLLLVPLWWRRRAPVAAFAAVAVILLAQWAAGIWVATGVVVLIMLHGVAARCSMRTLAVVAGVTTAQLTFAIYVLAPVGEHRLAALLLMLGTSSAGIAAGLAGRTFRAYRDAQDGWTAWLEAQRDQQAQLAAAAERARVAREMHDLVGHHLAIVIGLAQGSAQLAINRQESTAEPLGLIAETGRTALDDLRRVVGVLRDDTQNPELTPQPGMADMERMLAGVRAAGLTVTYRTAGDLHGLAPGLQLAVFRIVQEALTNTLKHAGPHAIAEVTVTADQNQVRVRASDNGRTTTRRSSSPAGGHGIVGIRERAALYGGSVIAGPGSGGWTVEVVMNQGSQL
ncbi:histidine kinase [Actinoplanes sp. NPDC026670]|uniref:sensor histidine kinase n=1 Tax=Actinoplanes sp. NPDC026670 TaxID=3154700 RepID=UPI0033FA5A2E